VEITSLDMLDDSSANTIPYLLPASSALLTSSSQPSYVQFGDVATSVEIAADNSVPTGYGLEQNFPNPFNPATVVRYHLPAAGRVKLVVYDLLGHEVAVLVNENKAAGSYGVRFDGTGLSSGVYLCRMTADRYVESRKMVFLR